LSESVWIRKLAPDVFRNLEKSGICADFPGLAEILSDRSCSASYAMVFAVMIYSNDLIIRKDVSAAGINGCKESFPLP